MNSQNVLSCGSAQGCTAGSGLEDVRTQLEALSVNAFSDSSVVLTSTDGPSMDKSVVWWSRTIRLLEEQTHLFSTCGIHYPGEGSSEDVQEIDICAFSPSAIVARVQQLAWVCGLGINVDTTIYNPTMLVNFLSKVHSSSELRAQSQLCGGDVAFCSRGGLISVPSFVAEKRGFVRIDLSNNFIASIPEKLSSWDTVTTLDLSNNSLCRLPDSIGTMANLQRLVVSNNFLVDLPPSIGKLTKLQELLLDSNRLRVLHSEIGKLHLLQRCNLNNNVIECLPESMKALHLLSFLSLSFNRLHEIPSWLMLLPALKTLVIAMNSLHVLPNSIPPPSALACSSNSPSSTKEFCQLSCLDISFNSFVPTGTHVLMHLSSVTQLTVSSRDLFPVSKKSHLLEYIEKMHHLQILQIWIDDKDLFSWSMASAKALLESNKSLAKVSILGRSCGGRNFDMTRR